jgi:parvulin-like peptidyl-prolyl isomerase
MKTWRNRLIALATALLVIGGLSAAVVLYRSLGRGAETEDPVIATVNGDPISLEQARSRTQSLARMHEGSAGPLTGRDWHEQVLRSLIDDVLIRQEAERRGIEVTDQQLAAAVRDVIDLFPSLADYQAWLDSEGLDQSDVEDRMELQIISARVWEAVTAEVRATAAELRAYYEEHRARFLGPDGAVAPFAEVREEVREELEQRMKDDAFVAWLQEAREQAQVRIVLPRWWRYIDERPS